jgi:hypothetical protein
VLRKVRESPQFGQSESTWGRKYETFNCILASLNSMAVCADTWAVEAVPPATGDKVFYGHVTMLKANGIFVLETMNTGRLAKEGINAFMFVLGQARIAGTAQMFINPVAR